MKMIKKGYIFYCVICVCIGIGAILFEYSPIEIYSVVIGLLIMYFAISNNAYTSPDRQRSNFEQNEKIKNLGGKEVTRFTFKALILCLLPPAIMLVAFLLYPNNH